MGSHEYLLSAGVMKCKLGAGVINKTTSTHPFTTCHILPVYYMSHLTSLLHVTSYQAVDCNSIGYGQERCAVFERGSKAAHSCFPNMEYSIIKCGQAEFRAVCPVRQGEQVRLLLLYYLLYYMLLVTA